MRSLGVSPTTEELRGYQKTYGKGKNNLHHNHAVDKIVSRRMIDCHMYVFIELSVQQHENFAELIVTAILYSIIHDLLLYKFVFYTGIGSEILTSEFVQQAGQLPLLNCESIISKIFSVLILLAFYMVKQVVKNDDIQGVYIYASCLCGKATVKVCCC